MSMSGLPRARGQPTFGRGGTTHSLRVTTPAGEAASWPTAGAGVLGASATGPGLEADSGDKVAREVRAVRYSGRASDSLSKPGGVGGTGHRTQDGSPAGDRESPGIWANWQLCGRCELEESSQGEGAVWGFM